MAENFVKQIDGSYDAEANVYNSIFEQYEHVIIQSLITSFGLDFLYVTNMGVMLIQFITCDKLVKTNK